MNIATAVAVAVRKPVLSDAVLFLANQQVAPDCLRGVHLGTKRSERSPGKRLGYSQIANPVYIARKETIA
jgi:hypothetical protein